MAKIDLGINVYQAAKERIEKFNKVADRVNYGISLICPRNFLIPTPVGEKNFNMNINITNSYIFQNKWYMNIVIFINMV